MRIILDLDDTLCKTKNRDWENSQPIADVCGKVREIKADSERLLQVGVHEIMNLGTSERRAQLYGMSATRYMHYVWNNPAHAHSPYRMFEGAMVPDGRDENNDIIYKYKGAKF